MIMKGVMIRNSHLIEQKNESQLPEIIKYINRLLSAKKDPKMIKVYLVFIYYLSFRITHIKWTCKKKPLD